MSTNFNLYRSRLSKYKIGNKDGKIDAMKKAVLSDFLLNPSHEEVLINETNYDVHIIDKGDNYKTILMKPNEIINVGDIVLWNDIYYICTYVNENNKVQCKGIITKCNNTLTFQDDETLEIYNIPCILEDKSTGGIDETEYIVLAEDKKLMIVPNNDITRKLYLNLNKKRYIFNNNKNDIYTISHVDDLSQPGLLNVILEISEYNPSIDRLDLNIADYKEAEEPEEPITEEGFTIKIVGTDSITVGCTESYTAKIYNNGTLVDNQSVTWTVSDSRLQIKNATDTTCDIYADFGNYNYGEYTLTATLDSDNGVTANKEIAVTLL